MGERDGEKGGNVDEADNQFDPEIELLTSVSRPPGYHTPFSGVESGRAWRARLSAPVASGAVPGAAPTRVP